MWSFSNIIDNVIKNLKANYFNLLAFTFILSISAGVITTIFNLVTLPIDLIFSSTIGILTIKDCGTALISLLSIIQVILSSAITLFTSYFSGCLIMVSAASVLLNFQATGKVDYGKLIEPFRCNLKNVLLISAKKSLKLTCWSFVFVIPAIIKYYQWFMVEFLLIEAPDMPESELFRISSETTQGEKMSIFVYLSLSGLIVGLGVLLCCVGQFFLAPISYLTILEVYMVLRNKTVSNQTM